MKLKKILASILCVAMVLSTMSFTAFATETTVSTAEDFYNAVKDAQSGDVINLTSSVTYDVWNSIANKDGITINGNGNTITVTDQVFANGNGGGLLRKASNLVINDLNVILPANPTAEMERLAIMSSGTLNNVSVTGGSFAVSIVDNGEVTINNCNFSDIGGWAIETEGQATDASLTISNSTFDEKAVIIRGENNTFTDNKITAESEIEGVNVLGNAVISGNDFGESSLGIDQGRTVTIKNNTINNVRFPNWFGAAEEDYSNVTVESNTLSDEVVEEMNDKLDVEVVSVDPVATVNGKDFYSLQEALKAITEENNVLNLLDNVTITEDWDCRYTGAKITVPVTINGNGHTLKFTGKISDAGNHDAVFRFEDDAIVKKLTIDLSEAANTSGRMRAISSKADLKVYSCTFIGNTNCNSRGIIFGEGSGAAIGDVEVFITSSAFENWKRGLTDNENGGDVEKVTATLSTFTNGGVYLSAAEKVEFTNNTMDGAWINITSYTQPNELAVTATGNTLDEDYADYNVIQAGKTIDAQEGFGGPVAYVNGYGFSKIQKALDSLDGKTGDFEVVIAPGTYSESFMVTQQAGVNVTIKAENKGDVTLTGKIYVNGNFNLNNAETLDIENLVFDGSAKDSAHKFIEDNNLKGEGNSNRTYAHNVTVTNCDFIGNGSFEDETAVQAVYCRQGNDIVIDGCTATNMHSLLWTSNTNGLTITNCKVTNCESVTTITSSPALTFTNNTVDVANFAVRTGQGNASTNTVADITMNNNTIKAGVTALAMRNSTTTAVMTDNNIDAPAVFTNDNSDNSTINGVAIVSDEIDSVISAANKMTLKFELVEPGLYNIVLTATDIYEFVGAELTFTNTSTTVANEPMNYEILGIDGTTNAEKSIEKADTYALRLVDGATRMSGEEIIIGQVKFYGQGDINFTVSEGKVVTTQYGTNLGQYYTVDADAATDDNLVIEGITNGAVEEVKRTVVVNVAYKHALDGTYWKDAAGNAANQITVTLKDGFGNIYGPFDVSDEIETIPDVKLGRLTVTLEAPGFRRYVYNTTLEAGADENDALVLNFWNDIKRGTVQSPLAEIEAGVSGETDKNFVVGDIVMDYTVDEYDLAAVTSYYGMYKLTDADKYIKYDLNRDGNIDIIDVHYVLHTLNN